MHYLIPAHTTEDTMSSTTLILQSEGDNSLLAIVVAIAIAVVGWVISLVLQKKNLSDQQRNQIKYDIYKQATLIHQETQDSLAKFSTASSLPFIMMDSCLIGVNQVILNKTQTKAIQDGWEYWNNHVEEHMENYFELVSNYQKLLYLIEDWAGPLKKLHYAQEVLTEEIGNLQRSAFSILLKWQTISTKRGYDWTKWDRAEIEREAKVLNDKVFDMTTYLSDFLILVHNELMAEYFAYKRSIRKPTDPKYKVLTKEGFLSKESIDSEEG